MEIEEKVMNSEKMLDIEQQLKKKPKVFLMDELLSNLDAKLCMQMYRIFQTLREIRWDYDLCNP